MGCTVNDSRNTVMRMDIRKKVQLQNTVMNVYLPLSLAVRKWGVSAIGIPIDAYIFRGKCIL